MKKSSSSSDQSDSAPAIPLIEWVVGALGFLLVFSAMALLIYEGLTEDPSPPDISVTAHTIAIQKHGHVALLNVYNQGGQPASRVAIAGELLDAQQKVLESSSTQIEFLPARSQREAGIFFTLNPKEHQLRVRALGFEKP